MLNVSIACGGHFDAEKKQWRIEEINLMREDPNLWSDPDRARCLEQELKTLSISLDPMKLAQTYQEDLLVLMELAEDDWSLVEEEVEQTFQTLNATLKTLEFHTMFHHPMDHGNAFMEIQSGSGGTEAQDWTEMLWRMYRRWIEKKGFSYEILDYANGDVAGIKGINIKITGAYAYGQLRTEGGVHRLVRKSPFDSGNRRHTSFSAVFITPELDDDIAITIDPSDLRIDTYRASGAGGQHINKTDSAIRITHAPTGLIVQCQSDRSQHKNRANAMKQLQAKLYDLEQKKKQDQVEAMNDQKSDITWGAQVRSYVLDDARIKDLRTGFESANTQAMLDGELLDDFIQASLLHNNFPLA